MSLPFLKRMKNRDATPIVYRKPDEKQDVAPEDDMNVVAKDVISAIGSGDHKALAQALRAAFTILDAEPHEEGPHINEESEEE